MGLGRARLVTVAPNARRCARALGIALICGLLAACAPVGTPTASGHPHWLRISLGQGDPNTLNIHLEPSATTGYIAELTQAYLARYDAHARPVPELVTVIPSTANGGISADGKTIVWHLRHGVRWSDGAPFDADDVVFSVRAILNPANNEEQGTAGWDLIEKMDEPDPYTVVFHLKHAYGSYLPLYFGTAADEPCILPKHILGSLPNINTAPYNLKPVGIGPFRVVAWKHGDAIELEANPYYWRGKPKLARITFKLLSSQETLMNQMQTGETDLWPLVPPSYIERLKGVSTVGVSIQPNFRTTNLDFVYTRPIVDDRRVREAIRAALDRPRMVQTVLHGYGSTHDGVVIPLDPPTEHDAIVPFDVAKAKALLDADGWRLAADGIRVKGGQRLVLHAVYPIGTVELDETMEAVRAELHDVGIELDSRKYASNVFRAPAADGGVLYGGKYELALFPRTLEAVSDVYGLYGCPNIPPHGENATRYCNPRVDTLLTQVEESYDAGLRRRLFGRVQRQIVDDVPTIMLYVWNGGYAQNHAVSGFHPPVLTPFDDMMNVDVQ
jgi:peptide/nickel transport system substrate-binding protein